MVDDRERRCRSRARSRRSARLKPTSTRRCAWACAITSARTVFPACCSGLSGGIDSALTLAIAVDALGADKVRAVMMPSQYTADISRDDSRAEAEALGVRYAEIAIKPVFDAFHGCAGGRVQGAGRGHDRGKPAVAHPRHAADGAVEQDRRDRAHHRQQERNGHRLCHALRRHGGRLCRAQGHQQDAGLPACQLSQQHFGGDSAARHHARAVGRTAAGPDRPGQPAAVRRARRDHGGLRRAQPEAARNRGRRVTRARTSSAWCSCCASANTSGARRRSASASRRAASARTGAIRSPTSTGTSSNEHAGIYLIAVQALYYALGSRLRHAAGHDNAGGISNEKNRSDVQTVQAGRSARSAVRNRRQRTDRDRGQGFRPAKGAYRTLSRRRICGRFSAQGENRSRGAGQSARARDRSHRQGRAHRARSATARYSSPASNRSCASAPARPTRRRFRGRQDSGSGSRRSAGASDFCEPAVLNPVSGS